MNRRAVGGALVALACLLVLFAAAEAKPGYLRNPDIHGDRIVFTAEGDLWTATADGKDVRRITSHVGDEAGARFSPDGKWIAFTGTYDGNTDVYVMPASGGEPVRLTWHPSWDVCRGWTPDGSRVAFLSWRESPNRTPELFFVPATGGEPEKTPLGWIAYFDVDPETGRYAFTRSSGGGTWKRYRGGTAADIWVGDPKKSDYAQVTTFEGADTHPMWHRGRIYFLCDQGGSANLWSMRPDGSDRKQLTAFDRWDVREPSMGPGGAILFTSAGDLHVFNADTNQDRVVLLDLPSERVLTRKRYPEPSQYLTSFGLSPGADRVAIIARGEIYSVPVKEGVTLPLTHGSGARERAMNFGPKGEKVVYVTDASGEETIATADAWGREEPKPVKISEKSTWLFPPVWSPDGKWIAYADQSQTLYVSEAGGGSVREVAHCDFDEIREYAWSPDGRWLAFTMANDVDFTSIYIYDTKESRTQRITGWTTSDHGPAWDPDGRYLYFLGDRVMNPLIGRLDFETVEFAMAKPYLVLLRKDVKNPLQSSEGLPPEKDGKEKGEDEQKGKKEDEKKGDDEEKEIKPVGIDFDGIEGRVLAVPVEAGRYVGLAATSGKLFYLSLPVEGLAQDFDFEGEPEPKAELVAFDWEKKEADTFLAGVSAYDLPLGADKIALMKGKGDLYVVDASSAPSELSESSVSLDGMVVELDPRDEWRQIFFDAWRNMRDFYWDAGMHGVDWKAIRDQYATLLPRLSTRDDLLDLIAEMIGELSTSHTYVWGGDRGKSVPSVDAGLLGARVEREGDAFKVTRIYRGDPADGIRSPLAEPGTGVKVGDYILAVNRIPFGPSDPFEARWENLAGKEVLITVNDRPSREGARDVVVKPFSPSDETSLIYADWVRANREYVSEKTGGKIAYIHVPDMGGRGLAAFDRWFYPQLDKEGMVVDMRWNGGGFVSQLIVSRLARHPIMFGRSRGGDTWLYPRQLLNGPFVVLTNEFAGSDGDLGPYAIQAEKLAPVIGKRSWGGVVGIRGDKALVDGGVLTQPEFAYWTRRQGWGLENRGVQPDIEVENLPQDIGRGIDAQLDRGIAEVLRLHGERPPVKPVFEPAPDRSRGAYRGELK